MILESLVTFFIFFTIRFTVLLQQVIRSAESCIILSNAHLNISVRYFWVPDKSLEVQHTKYLQGFVSALA